MLRQLPELRHLDLHRIDTITDEGISQLANLRKVETFFCPSPLLTDASMAVFGSWGRSLLQIRLNSDRITDAGMAHMAGCTRLTNMFVRKRVTRRGVVRLEGKPLVTIVLWGNRNIDDRALEELVPLWERTPTLTGLDLGRTAITDAGLEILYRLNQLEWIYVGESEGVTGDGVRALKEGPSNGGMRRPGFLRFRRSGFRGGKYRPRVQPLSL